MRPTPVLASVVRDNGGGLIAVEDDVHGVVRELHEIDPRLKVRRPAGGDYFVIYFEDEHESYLVTTAQQLDKRIIDAIREIANEQYDYAAELEQVNDAATKRREQAFSEALGDGAERLRWALRKDLGLDQSRVFIPG